MSTSAILTKCPLANCPLSKCPLANCPLSKCPLANCPLAKCPLAKCLDTISDNTYCHFVQLSVQGL